MSKSTIKNEENEINKQKIIDMVNKSIDCMREQTEKLKSSMVGCVSNKPFKWLGITFIAGVAIGCLLKK